jgi:hypothetical protein
VVALLLDGSAWAERNFGVCQLGDQRRTRRLVTVAERMAEHPDGSTPDQFETWSDLKAVYRLFDSAAVTFSALIAPHCQRTRDACLPGDVKLILNDTTELNFGGRRAVAGLGATGKGTGRGFLLHTALMVDPADGRVEGLAAQEIFYRPLTPRPKRAKRTQRRRAVRESQVWGRVIDRIGAPPPGVRWWHVCDRGADDYEVFCHAIRAGCGFVIRASSLHRKIQTPGGERVALSDDLARQQPWGQRQIAVRATVDTPPRTAVVELRFAPIGMPRPETVTRWIRDHAPREPLALWVVELREVSPPAGVAPLRWVLYTTQPVTDVATAEAIVQCYERRWLIEEYHKALKTGCQVEERRYQTADRLERIVGLLSVLAVRLLQWKTVARETPQRPAREVAPAVWIRLLQRIRHRPQTADLTIHQFVRELAGLGGHLGRKHDGEPGWITLWRGLTKLHLIVRGAEAERQKCG